VLHIVAALAAEGPAAHQPASEYAQEGADAPLVGGGFIAQLRFPLLGAVWALEIKGFSHPYCFRYCA